MSSNANLNLTLGSLPPTLRALVKPPSLPVGIVIEVALIATVVGVQLVVEVQLVRPVVPLGPAFLWHKQAPHMVIRRPDRNTQSVGPRLGQHQSYERLAITIIRN